MAVQRIHHRMVDLVQAEGVDTLFGIPDPSFFGMFIEGQKRGMEIVSPHHESVAAMMADGYYRMCGKPGVICINKGPGVANVASGANYLKKENIPAVFIMAQRHRLYEQRVRRGMTQFMKQPPMFEGVMKYIGVVEYIEQLDEVFQEAFRQALSGVPGPTYIEIPLHIMQGEIDLPPVLAPNRYRLVNQQAGTDAIAEAVTILTNASHPILLLGQGAMASRAHDQVIALANKIGCPIINTISVEAVLEGMDDRTLPYGSASASELVARADAVLAIGTEIGEAMHYGRGRHWSKGKTDRKWIYIEQDPTAIGVNRPIDVPLVGDLRAVVPQLTHALGDFQGQLPLDVAGFVAAHQAYKDALVAKIPNHSSPIHTGRLAVEATRAIPANSVIVRDGGAASMWFNAALMMNPRDAMWSSNYGAIGTGLPYALGAKLVVRDTRPVVVLTGDSSILFHISELETAVRKNLPVVIVVSVDYAWGLEEASYKANFGPDTPIPEARWSRTVRLDKTAESFGAYGEFVDKTEDIAPAIQRALASGRPALIHVEVDPSINSSFAEVPGFAEFRTWYGEETDNLSPLVNKGGDPDGSKGKSSGSGY